MKLIIERNRTDYRKSKAEHGADHADLGDMMDTLERNMVTAREIVELMQLGAVLE